MPQGTRTKAEGENDPTLLKKSEWRNRPLMKEETTSGWNGIISVVTRMKTYSRVILFSSFFNLVLVCPARWVSKKIRGVVFFFFRLLFDILYMIPVYVIRRIYLYIYTTSAYTRSSTRYHGVLYTSSTRYGVLYTTAVVVPDIVHWLILLILIYSYVPGTSF